MLSSLLSNVGLPVLVAILGGVLGTIDNPAAKTASKALEKVDEALRSGQITPEQLAEANRHTEKMAQMEIENENTHLEQINQSLRAEISSEDPYVRRMRPTFGYLMAITWGAQMLGIAYVIIFDTDKPARLWPPWATSARYGRSVSRCLEYMSINVAPISRSCAM